MCMQRADVKNRGACIEWGCASETQWASVWWNTTFSMLIVGAVIAFAYGYYRIKVPPGDVPFTNAIDADGGKQTAGGGAGRARGNKATAPGFSLPRPPNSELIASAFAVFSIILETMQLCRLTSDRRSPGWGDGPLSVFMRGCFALASLELPVNDPHADFYTATVLGIIFAAAPLLTVVWQIVVPWSADVAWIAKGIRRFVVTIAFVPILSAILGAVDCVSWQPKGQEPMFWIDDLCWYEIGTATHGAVLSSCHDSVRCYTKAHEGMLVCSMITFMILLPFAAAHHPAAMKVKLQPPPTDDDNLLSPGAVSSSAVTTSASAAEDADEDRRKQVLWSRVYILAVALGKTLIVVVYRFLSSQAYAMRSIVCVTCLVLSQLTMWNGSCTKRQVAIVRATGFALASWCALVSIVAVLNSWLMNRPKRPVNSEGEEEVFVPVHGGQGMRNSGGHGPEIGEIEGPQPDSALPFTLLIIGWVLIIAWGARSVWRHRMAKEDQIDEDFEEQLGAGDVDAGDPAAVESARPAPVTVPDDHENASPAKTPKKKKRAMRMPRLGGGKKADTPKTDAGDPELM